ncbi:MAG TPA: alpha-amylase family glycosyl hydrolase [Cytophagaceae bacterium]|nr:alpha-amylase family glycosyl hydrolase [Cytophagaceae bacterium]
MSQKSLSDINLSKENFSNENYINRPWKEEIIYFLIVDRFHDGKAAQKAPDALRPEYQQTDLMKRRGGTFKGIQGQLNYIKNLGCTTIWLSPVFENYEKDYHGYAINNFLNTDPRFGTIEELKELVKKAHELELRVVLDVVINHTANTWEYENGYISYNGTSHRFGHWKDDQYPLPQELRNPDYYKKAGAIEHWDSYPETQEGDIFELKKLITDNSPVGWKVLEAMIKIYSFWIKECAIDGFRLDTVKHLEPSAVAVFCHKIREYAKYLGKDQFMIFGEAVGNYSLISRYFKQVKTERGYFEGLDAAFDFPLHFILEELIKGKRPASDLYQLYRSNKKMLARRNKKTSDWIVFADNHDQIAQGHKARIGFEAEEKQVIAMIGLVYFLYGIPCLYYGTEQYLQGNGPHDAWLREPMFHQEKDLCWHKEESFLYKEISSLAALRKKMFLFSEAEMEIDFISINGGDFVSSEHIREIIYWSKRIYEEKMILLYNPKKDERVAICAKLSTNGSRIKSKLEYSYGGNGELNIDQKEGCGYINIDLNPLQFVILK